SNDPRTVLRQALDRVYTDLDTAAAGDAVENHRQPGGGGDLAEVLIETFLSGLVVVRGDLERTIGPDPGGLTGQVHGFASGIATRAGEDLDPAGGDFDGQFDDPDVLIVIKRR